MSRVYPRSQESLWRASTRDGQASELWRHQGGTFNILLGFGVCEDEHIVPTDPDWHVGLVVGVVVLRRGLGT